MRGLVFFNMHHVIFGLTVYVKKLKLSVFKLFESEEIGGNANLTQTGRKTLSAVKKGTRVADTG